MVNTIYEGRMTSKDYLEDDLVKLWKEDNILFSEYKSEILDLEAAKNTVKSRLQFTDNKTYPVVIDITNIRTVTKEARDYLSRGEAISHLSAAAIIANSLATRLLFNFFLTFSKPALPMRIFNSKDEAIKWIGQFAAQQN